jgi:predicted phage tail protein
MKLDDAEEPFDPATAWLDPPGIGKALTVGVGVGVAAAFIVVAGGFLAGGQGWGPALGMGAFVALWGGLGFGGMIGGVVYLTRADAAGEQARHRSDRQPEAALDGPPAGTAAPPSGPRSSTASPRQPQAAA